MRRRAVICFSDKEVLRVYSLYYILNMASDLQDFHRKVNREPNGQEGTGKIDAFAHPLHPDLILSRCRSAASLIILFAHSPLVRFKFSLKIHNLDPMNPHDCNST